MTVKRKAIFKKAQAQNLLAKKYSTIRKQLDGFRGVRPMPGGGDGMIHLDPREWGGNGGFVDTPGGVNKPMPGGGDGMIRLDPREWNGGFDQPPADAMRSKLQALLQQRQFQKPQPGPGNGMIQLDPREWNGGFDEVKQAVMPPNYQPGNEMNHRKEQFERALNQGQLRPQRPGGGMIHLDPRERNGGFDRPQTPMPMPGMPGGGQRPMPMPGLNNPGMRPPVPMPGLGGGMPLQPPQGPKQMPMPNPRRNLIPRPIDPRYKAF